MPGTPITREWLEQISGQRIYRSEYFTGGLDSDYDVTVNGEVTEYYNLTDGCIDHGTLTQEELLLLFRENMVPFKPLQTN